MRTRALALLLVGCASATPVPVTVWSMSGCPCSAQFAFDFNASIWSFPEMRSAIEFKQPFSASAKKDNLTSCFHGDKECRFEKWLLCAQVQDFDAAFDWELCVDGHCTGDFFPNLDPCSTQYENPDNATLMQTCAAKAGLDYAKLQACAAGAEGEQLLLEDARHYTASYGIQGLPVVQVAGKVPLAELPSPSREFEQVPALPSRGLLFACAARTCRCPGSCNGPQRPLHLCVDMGRAASRIHRTSPGGGRGVAPAALRRPRRRRRGLCSRRRYSCARHTGRLRRIGIAASRSGGLHAEHARQPDRYTTQGAAVHDTSEEATSR